MTIVEEQHQPVPLENLAAEIRKAFAEAAGVGPKPDRVVPEEAVRLMSDAFGRAEAVRCSPNVLPFVRRAAPG